MSFGQWTRLEELYQYIFINKKKEKEKKEEPYTYDNNLALNFALCIV